MGRGAGQNQNQQYQSMRRIQPYNNFCGYSENYGNNYSHPGRFSGGRFGGGRGFQRGSPSGRIQGRVPFGGRGPYNSNHSGRSPGNVPNNGGRSPQNYFYQPGRGSGRNKMGRGTPIQNQPARAAAEIHHLDHVGEDPNPNYYRPEMDQQHGYQENFSNDGGYYEDENYEDYGYYGENPMGSEHYHYEANEYQESYHQEEEGYEMDW